MSAVPPPPDDLTSAPAPPSTTATTGARAATPSVGEVVDYVKTYARQETVGPLKGAGRWVGYGVAGAVLLGLGLTFLVLGVLRLLQTEWDRSARGSLSWLAYVIALVVCGALLAVVASRMKQDHLSKGPR